MTADSNTNDRPIAGAPLFSLRRYWVGSAYPRNGSRQDTTKRYHYALLLGGRVVDSCPRARPLIASAKTGRDCDGTPYAMRASLSGAPPAVAPVSSGVAGGGVL